MPEVLLLNGDKVRQRAVVDCGTSIQAAERIICCDGFTLPVIAMLGDRPVLRKEDGWCNTLLKDGDVLVFVELPLGGRSGSAIAVQMVAMVAAIAATWYLGGSGGALVGAGMSTTTANITAGVVGMTISMAGALAASAISSQGLLDAKGAESASPTYSINSASNMARLNQPEAECFGRIRMVPDYVAQPYTEYASNDEWGYFVYGIGRGSYEVESLMYGDTEFWHRGQYVESGYTTEQGQLYNHVHDIDISHLSDYSTAIRATGVADKTKTITISVRFPNGYGRTATCTDDGEVREPAITKTARLHVQCAPIDNSGNVIGPWGSYKLFEESFCSDIEVDWDVEFKAPSFDQWAIRVKQTFDDPHDYQPFILHSVRSHGIAVRVEFVEPGNTVKLFPSNIYTSPEVQGLEMLGTNDPGYGEGYIGPYAATPPGIETDTLKIDYAYPTGLGQAKKDGSLAKLEVTWWAEAQKIDDDGAPLGAYFSLGRMSDIDKTTSAKRITRSFSVPLGRYRVRVIRTSKTNLNNKNLDKLTWTGLRAVIPGKVTFPQSVVAVRIMATNALSQGGGSRFSVTQTRKLPLYDTSSKTWSEPVPTRSWAAALCSVCKASWGGRMTDRQLDLDTIWRIGASLESRGWHVDCCVDGAMSMWNIIRELCQVVMVVPRMTGTVLSAVEDKEGRPVRWELNARNVMRGSFGVTYNTWTSNTPDAVIMNYIDAAEGFARRDVECVLPGGESTEPVTLDWIGVTSREHAFRLATGYAARNRHRRITVTCQVEGLGRIVQVGDVVSVNHPRFRNTGAGIIRAFNRDTLELHVKFDFRPDSSVTPGYVSLTMPNGNVWGPVKASLAGDVISLDRADYAAYVTQSGIVPFSWIFNGTQFAVHESSAFQRRMLVQSVTVDDLWHYTLTLINDAPEAYGYQDLPVPLFGTR